MNIFTLHSEHMQNIFPSVWAFMNMLPENTDFDHKQSSEKNNKGPSSECALFVEDSVIYSSIYIFIFLAKMYSYKYLERL